MSSSTRQIESFLRQPYEAGFVTDIEEDTLPPGLDENVIRQISLKKGEPDFMREWRLSAYRHWQGMKEPHWSIARYEPIDYQGISYFSSPKSRTDGPTSLDEVDPKLLETYEKLGIPLHERAALAGVAVDAVFDSVSVATTFRKTLARAGVIFCPISEAIRDYPELVRTYLGSVVPPTDNFFASLNSAVFTDGSFVYIPKGVRCPLELSRSTPLRTRWPSIETWRLLSSRIFIRRLPRGSRTGVFGPRPQTPWAASGTPRGRTR